MRRTFLWFWAALLPVSAQARDLCYKGVIEFDPSSVQFFVTPDKTEYWLDRERTGLGLTQG